MPMDGWKWLAPWVCGRRARLAWGSTAPLCSRCGCHCTRPQAPGVADAVISEMERFGPTVSTRCRAWPTPCRIDAARCRTAGAESSTTKCNAFEGWLKHHWQFSWPEAPIRRILRRAGAFRARAKRIVFTQALPTVDYDYAKALRRAMLMTLAVRPCAGTPAGNVVSQ